MKFGGTQQAEVCYINDQLTRSEWDVHEGKTWTMHMADSVSLFLGRTLDMSQNLPTVLIYLDVFYVRVVTFCVFYSCPEKKKILTATRKTCLCKRKLYTLKKLPVSGCIQKKFAYYNSFIQACCWCMLLSHHEMKERNREIGHNPKF